MKEIDEFDLIRCKYQADFFEYATDKMKANSASFIKAFANSTLAKLMDKEEFIFESLDIERAYEELIKEKSIRSTDKQYSAEVMSWIGYLLRYWSIYHNTSTQNIYKIIKPEELNRIYEAYHSLDVTEAIDRILDAKKINYNLNNVEILKKIYML